MEKTDAPVVSEAEEAAVSKLLTAYALSLRADLLHASDGPRVFVILTSANGRVGRFQFATDLSDEDLKRLLREVLENHEVDRDTLFRFKA